MATVSIVFTGANKNPYLPSDNVNGANFTSRRTEGQLTTNAFQHATADAVWSCDVDPAVNTFSVKLAFDTIDSNARGIVISSGSTGNGFVFLANNVNIRVFSMTAWVLGGVLNTYTTTFPAGGELNIDVTQSSGQYVLKNGTTVVNTFTNTTYTSGLRAGLTTRTGGRITSFQLTYTSPFALNTLTTPLVPGAAFSGTSTGFSDGAATISFGGVSVGVTIASGAFSSTVPMVADNVAWPKLPATGQTITLTQSGNSAIISDDISLPVGYDTIRNLSGVPANFFDINTTGADYLGKAFNDASNPLTTNDTWLYQTSSTTGNRKVYQDSAVGIDVLDSGGNPTLPATFTDFCYRGATGKYFSHLVTLNAAGEIVVIGNATSGTNIGIYIGIGI